MLGTISEQGVITSTGNDYTIKLVSDVDFLHVYNWTRSNAGIAAATGVEWYWQRGMLVNDGLVEGYAAGGAFPYIKGTCSALLSGGFTLINSSTRIPGAAVLFLNSAGSNAVQPVYLVAAITGLSNGAIVRMQSTAQTNLNGLDFSIDAVAAGTFRLANALATAPGIVVAAGAGITYRLVAANIDEYNKYYPSRRTIANITQAAAGVVTTLVDHSLTTGQQVRINVPAGCGMIELNGQLVTVTVINASTFSINVDTTGYTAFNFPLPAAVAFTPAEMVPVGISPFYNTSITAALVDNDFRGIKLSSFNTGAIFWAPAGTAGDVIYWQAGKSSNV